jgi:hypothetical protein
VPSRRTVRRPSDPSNGSTPGGVGLGEGDADANASDACGLGVGGKAGGVGVGLDDAPTASGGLAAGADRTSVPATAVMTTSGTMRPRAATIRVRMRIDRQDPVRSDMPAP